MLFAFMSFVKYSYVKLYVCHLNNVGSFSHLFGILRSIVFENQFYNKKLLVLQVKLLVVSEICCWKENSTACCDIAVLN